MEASRVSRDIGDCGESAVIIVEKSAHRIAERKCGESVEIEGELS